MKNLCLFLRGILGGSLYCLTEILWRGFSHISMFLVGGICFVLLSFIGRMKQPFVLRVLIGAGAVTVIEFVSGCILNLMLNLNVWDYSARPFNLLGQVCLLFMILWIPLCAMGILINQWLDQLQAMIPPVRRPGEAR